MLWFTADLHLGAPYTFDRRRPFDSQETCDKTILKNLKSCVSKEDRLIVVGDLFNCTHSDTESWESTGARVRRTGLHIQLIMGNNEDRILREKFDGNMAEFKKYCAQFNIDVIGYSCVIKLNKLPLYVTHDPDACNSSHLNIYGHVHEAGQISALGFNVGQDVNGYFPVSERELCRRIYNVTKYFDKSVKASTNIKDISLWRKYYHDTKQFVGE